MRTKEFIKKQILRIKRRVGDQKALVACSGGVDSTACALLAHQALGKNLLAVFIDDGLMRQGEPEEVVGLLRRFGVKTRLVRKRRRFFRALKGRVDPEKKSRLLGEIVKKEKAGFLIQGTIKADIIETVGGVKTQHNILKQIGIDPRKYGFEIIEPLKTLFKPEVRLVARALGLPKQVWDRMPFPGPGLAVRVVGEVRPRRVSLLRKATKIIEEELRRYSPFQAFAVLLSDRATGVKKGKRIFGQIIVIRAVDSQDAMTASVSRIPLTRLKQIQKRVVNEVPGVSRVLFDLTPKPPATIEYI